MKPSKMYNVSKWLVENLVYIACMVIIMRTEQYVIASEILHTCVYGAHSVHIYAGQVMSSAYTS